MALRNIGSHFFNFFQLPLESGFDRETWYHYGISSFIFGLVTLVTKTSWIPRVMT